MGAVPDPPPCLVPRFRRACRGRLAPIPEVRGAPARGPQGTALIHVIAWIVAQLLGRVWGGLRLSFWLTERMEKG
jgi:hypothetical protein